nr:MAG TPA: hypothetical protein [Caudoviricetes sp.]
MSLKWIPHCLYLVFKMNTQLRKAPYSHEPGRCRRHG